MKHAPAARPGTTTEWLEVIRLSKTDWRVSDSRLGAADPVRLLGYIEKQLRDRYEVLWMTEPLRWGYVASFEAAIAGFGDDAASVDVVSAERQEPPANSRPR